MALKHYDNFYAKIYADRWQSIRLGLLSPKKYAAIVNNFVDFESVEIELRQLGAYNLRYIYNKNLKSILKKLEHHDFIQSRKINDYYSDKNIGMNIILLLIHADLFSILESNLSELEKGTESETERIEAFFTDENDLETVTNAASMVLDLNEFVPATELKYNENVTDDSDYFNFYKMNYDVSVNVVNQNVLDIPPMLNLYTFRSNDFSTFPQPKLTSANLFNYYLVDMASALPILLLDIQDGDYVADFCAAPGGKSLMMFLTMKNARFFLNDISSSRFERLKNVFDSFIQGNYHYRIKFNQMDVCNIKKYDQFDKVLVDVPCTNDRHSLFVNENNIFSHVRVNERIGLPMKQLDLLYESLKSVKLGGTVVYSTCSLSPIQNDGVVHMALKRIQEETDLDFDIVQTKEALRPLRNIFQLYYFKYGVQILPYLPSNFGPMYFAKLIRTN